MYSSVQPMDFVRYVSGDLTGVALSDNRSPVRTLIRRFSEVSDERQCCWEEKSLVTTD